MAAGTWAVYAKAKYNIGAGIIILGGGVFKMCLCTTAGSAIITALSSRSTWGSMNTYEISARGGYVANGRNIAPVTGTWAVGASAKQYKFTMSTIGVAFTASGSSLINVRYAVIRNSTGAGAGKVLCYVALSTAQFTVASPNILTVLPHANGIFTLA